MLPIATSQILPIFPQGKWEGSRRREAAVVVEQAAKAAVAAPPSATG